MKNTFNKAAIVSDIHGNFAALEAVAADIKRRDINNIYNLGDHISGPLWPKETLHFLINSGWVNISGNHDRLTAFPQAAELSPSDEFAFRNIDTEDIKWLAALPSTLLINENILLCHGAPGNDTVYLLETIHTGRVLLSKPEEITNKLGEVCTEVILCGHTHLQRTVTIPGGCLIVNPGSVGLPAYDDTQPEFHVVESGSPHARYSIIESVGSGFVIEHVQIEYDYVSAAIRAEENNRPDWAYALRTGFMNTEN